jgi:hypothetical protein
VCKQELTIKQNGVSSQFFLTGKIGGTRLLKTDSPGIEVFVPNQAVACAPAPEVVSRLARFFPDATPVRIPIKLSRNQDDDDRDESGSKNAFLQNTVIEFGTPRELLFVVDNPLEFADRVLVESTDGSFRAEASVVAVQYHPKQTAIAVRFLKPVPNWIVKS